MGGGVHDHRTYQRGKTRWTSLFRILIFGTTEYKRPDSNDKEEGRRKNGPKDISEEGRRYIRFEVLKRKMSASG